MCGVGRRKLWRIVRRLLLSYPQGRSAESSARLATVVDRAIRKHVERDTRLALVETLEQNARLAQTVAADVAAALTGAQRLRSLTRECGAFRSLRALRGS